MRFPLSSYPLLAVHTLRSVGSGLATVDPDREVVMLNDIVCSTLSEPTQIGASM